MNNEDLNRDDKRTIILNHEQAAAKAALLAECEKFAGAGVTFVAVHFAGSGDDGVAEEVRCYDAEEYDYEECPMEFDASRLHSDFNAFVPDGFEIDGGGFGDIVLDVKARKITIEHTEHFEEYSTSTYEI